jgi:hypothetical protein
MVIYEKRENHEVIDGRKSENLHTYRGFKQGNILSPVLYNMVIDEIIKKSNEKIREWNTKNYGICRQHSCMGTK